MGQLRGSNNATVKDAVDLRKFVQTQFEMFYKITMESQKRNEQAILSSSKCVDSFRLESEVVGQAFQEKNVQKNVSDGFEVASGHSSLHSQVAAQAALTSDTLNSQRHMGVLLESSVDGPYKQAGAHAPDKLDDLQSRNPLWVPWPKLLDEKFPDMNPVLAPPDFPIDPPPANRDGYGGNRDQLNKGTEDQVLLRGQWQPLGSNAERHFPDQGRSQEQNIQESDGETFLQSEDWQLRAPTDQ